MMKFRKKNPENVTVGDSATMSVVRMVTSLVLVCAAFATMSYMMAENPAAGEKGLGGMTVSAGELIRAKRSKIEEVSYLEAVINMENPLPEDYAPDNLILVGYTDVRMEETAAKQLEAMMSEMEQQGMTIQLVTGYVSYGRQATLFDRKVTELLLEQGHLSFDEVMDMASAYVDRAGTSEHQTGCSINIAVDELADRMEETEEGEWLLENCHRFGFIQRYPEDKAGITGVSDEPWHFRYVGKEMAQRVYETGLCLEELV